jgi:hypothetical protein
MKGSHSPSGRRSLSADYLKRSQRIFHSHEIDDDGLIEPQEDHLPHQQIYTNCGLQSRSNAYLQKHKGTFDNSFESQEQLLRMNKQRLELSPNPRQKKAATDRSRKIEQERQKPRITNNQSSGNDIKRFSNQIVSQQQMGGHVPNRRPLSRPAAPNLNATSLRSQAKFDNSSAPLINDNSPTSPRTLKLSLRSHRSSPTQLTNSTELDQLHLHPNKNSTSAGNLSESIISPIDQTRVQPLPSSPSSSTSSFSRQPSSQLSDNRHSPSPSLTQEIRKKRVEEKGGSGKRLTVDQLLHSQTAPQAAPSAAVGSDEDDDEDIDLPSVNLLVEKFYRNLQSRANGRLESFKRRLQSERSDG